MNLLQTPPRNIAVQNDTRVSPLAQKLEQSVAATEQSPARKDRQPAARTFEGDAMKIVKILREYSPAKRAALLAFADSALTEE